MIREYIQVDGTELEPAAPRLVAAGFRQTSIDENVTPEEMAAILDSLSSNDYHNVMADSARIVPRGKRTFQSGKNTISGIDFDVVVNERPVTRDPIFIVEGPDVRKIMVILKGILVESVLTDVVNKALTSGILSNTFKTSVADYARLANLPSEMAYQKCVKMIIAGSVTSLKSLVEIRPKTIQPTKQAVPKMVR